MPQVEFIATPGYLSGRGARERAGLPQRGGPINVVSTLGLMDHDRELAATCRMRLVSTYSGVSVEEVLDSAGFGLLVGDEASVNEPPSAEELCPLREEIDPEGLYI